ncbi:hypothetical protein PILCRDRAFT_487913 [Piloderma croceum F 1598]|uniref:Uncharacterized protein n=1 Tax=Piloderma croceum (strain F 1598) TaxID=765440 RepID=A0A0C3FAQ3_PILCF|nr:hypothetical protein PILCRDRAFT_487913 [Piloderma croceum F 1598]
MMIDASNLVRSYVQSRSSAQSADWLAVQHYHPVQRESTYCLAAYTFEVIAGLIKSNHDSESSLSPRELWAQSSQYIILCDIANSVCS